ncbi:TPA_asm: UL46.5 sORF 1 [Human alphaherpesvirus 1]|jgi:hypothetical protein
MRPA